MSWLSSAASALLGAIGVYDERRRVEVQTQVVSQLLQQLNDAVGAVVRKAKRDGGDAGDSSSIGTLLCDADDVLKLQISGCSSDKHNLCAGMLLNFC